MDKKSVLVVDDSLLAREVIRKIICENFEDWDISIAKNGAEALASLDRHCPDFVTMDLNMPGRDGLEISAELLERSPHSKIALVTANIQEAVRGRAEALGIAFIEKPITEKKIADFLLAPEVESA